MTSQHNFSDKHVARAVADRNKTTDSIQEAKKLFQGLRELPTHDHKFSPQLRSFYREIDGKLRKEKNKDGVIIAYPTPDQIEEYCRRHNIAFTDHSFAPSDDILFKKCNPAEELQGANRHPAVWKRPTEFLATPSDVQLFGGVIAPGDIVQGMLGDCWLLSSLAALAEHPHIVQECFESGHERYSKEGIYIVRFYKEGQVESLSIDDHIPCHSSNKRTSPIYSKSPDHKNALWVILLEKAFAKYNGSYASLGAGKPFEALIDLTGCPFKEYRFQTIEVKYLIDNDHLFQNLLMFDEEGFCMTAETAGKDQCSSIGERKGPDCGIVPGHAYSLLHVVQLRNETRLIRLRNPWGKFVWKGAWSNDENCHDWDRRLQHEVADLVGEDEEDLFGGDDNGTFWMCWKDFLDHFASISAVLCYNLSHKNEKKKAMAKKWNVTRNYITFNLLNKPNQYNVGVKTNIFKLTVKSTGHFYFSVHQKDRRVLTSVGYFDFGVSVLKLTADGKFDLVTATGNTAERQVQCHVHHLVRGDYWVVPTSTGTKLKQYYDLAIAAKKPPVEKRSGGLVIHSLAQFSLNEITSTGAKGALPDHLIDLVREAALELPMTTEDMHENLKYADPAADHTKKKLVVPPNPTFKFDNGYEKQLKIFALRSGHSGRSYAAVNITEPHPNPESNIYFEVTADCSNSKGYISSRGEMISKTIIGPGENGVLHHLFPATDSSSGTIKMERTTRMLPYHDEAVIKYLQDNPLAKERIEKRSSEVAKRAALTAAALTGASHK